MRIPPMKRTGLNLVLGLGLAACSEHASEASVLQHFQTHLQSLCGQSYLGRVTSTDPQDENWRKEVLTLGPVSCPDSVTTILGGGRHT